MRSAFHSAALAFVFAACIAPAPAQEKGYWRAASSNAASITGDVQITDTRVSINLLNFTIAQIRHVSSAETSAVFASDPTGAPGNLYRLNVSAGRHFLHHNTLCGSDNTQWMVASVADRTLRIAFFSGANTPVLTAEALANSSDLCGTFTYVR